MGKRLLKTFALFISLLTAATALYFMLEFLMMTTIGWIIIGILIAIAYFIASYQIIKSNEK